MKLKQLAKACMVVSPVVLMTACGGQDAAISESGSEEAKVGAFTLAITDGPVDDAEKVVVEIEGITVKPEGGEPVEIEFDHPKSIDLLDLQGKDSLDLVSDIEMEACDYEWVELDINADEDGVMDSYIERMDGTIEELDIPDDFKGLRVEHDFDIAEGEATEFTIDVDLRKSVFARDGEGERGADFRPSMRMVEDKEAGHILGDIDAEVIMDMCDDANAEDGSVYVYEGEDVELTDLSDEEGPVATALVDFEDGEYSYEVGYLPKGKYTLAYTCGADKDRPDFDDEMWFAVEEGAEVEAQVDFEADFEWGGEKYHHFHEDCTDDAVEGEDGEEASDDGDTVEAMAEGDAEVLEDVAEDVAEEIVGFACEWRGEWHHFDHEEGEFRPGRGDRGDRELPEGELPEFDGELPEFDGELPEFDGELPEFDGELPEFDGELPEFDKDHDWEDTRPADGEELPEFDFPEGELPEFEGELPEFEGELPEFESELPEGEEGDFKPRWDREDKELPVEETAEESEGTDAAA